MLVIRLTRVGKKNSPAYRVVVADKRRAVKRKFIEILGNYNPILKPKTITISKDRALFWLEKGAQPSDTVRNLMVDLSILGKDQKVAKVYGKAKPKKAPTEEPAKAVAAAETSEETTETTKSPVVEESAPSETAEESRADEAGEGKTEESSPAEEEE